MAAIVIEVMCLNSKSVQHVVDTENNFQNALLQIQMHNREIVTLHQLLDSILHLIPQNHKIRKRFMIDVRKILEHFQGRHSGPTIQWHRVTPYNLKMRKLPHTTLKSL